MKTITKHQPHTKTKKQISLKAKIWFTIGCVVAGIAIGALSWLIYNAIINPAEEYTPENNHNNYTVPERTTCLRYHADGACSLPMVAKPIIYLYPETITEVSIKLGHPNKLTTSYPHYTDGWNILAEPNGDLTDLATNRRLYALYWEGSQGAFDMTNEGFIVPGSKTSEFLEEKLAILGLNEREAEEFIVYWLPILEQNEYNYVRFATAEEIEDYMPLQITPTPDTVIRVLMITRPLEQPMSLTEQTLPQTPSRTGFTVVEWGGTK